MKINNSNFYNFFHSLFGILFLISGSVFSYDLDISKAAVQFFSLFYILIFFIKNKEKLIISFYHLGFMLVGGFLLLFSMFFSQEISYAFSKFDSIIFSTVISSIYFNILISKNGFGNFLKSLIFVGLFLLIPTFFYKLEFGFYQRDVRFFLNGANVFGWLSGFYAILCLIFIRKKIFLLLFFIFMACVFWSQSKGALISLFISGILILLYKNKFSLKSIFNFLIFVPIILFSKYLIENYFPESRISAIFRIIGGETDDSDYGSVGIRLEMYASAINLFKDNIVRGVGLGDFSVYTNYDIMYPHNVPLEILSETGILGAAFFIFIYFLFILKNRNFYLLIFVFYFFVVCLFSGDLSYLRYSITFLLLGFISQPKLIKE